MVNLLKARPVSLDTTFQVKPKVETEFSGEESVGEGSKGKTAGRGTKGSAARNNVGENFEGGQMPMHMRVPKLRGFKNPFRTEYQIVNLDKLSALFPEGGSVDVADLVAAGAVRDGHLVKILGTGDISVALQVSANAFSGSAKEKIAAAGGSTTQV